MEYYLAWDRSCLVKFQGRNRTVILVIPTADIAVNYLQWPELYGMVLPDVWRNDIRVFRSTRA